MLGRDPKTGLVKLRPESLDDLWHLYNLVERGDLAEAVTMRRTEARLDKDREGRTDKKPMLIAVRVETVEFHDFANRLRVFGTIERGPQEHGAHHTLNVEPLDEIAIVKPVWKPHHEERIREAVEASLKPRVVFVAIEEGEAVVAVLRHYGVHRAAELYGPKRGKQFAGREADRTDFFEEIALAVGQARGDDAPLLVVGPGFVKEELVAWGQERHPETFRG
ncbi:MAG: mRNA surveillance protein pelota, partial [Methanobacteriota archaeon]